MSKLTAALATLPEPAYKGSWEPRYAAYLDEQITAGAIARQDYEPETLVLGTGARFTPDFRVVRNDGVVEFHEVKGRKREAAIVRLKVAARLHPYIFRMVKWNSKAKSWDSSRIPA